MMLRGEFLRLCWAAGLEIHECERLLRKNQWYLDSPAGYVEYYFRKWDAEFVNVCTRFMIVVPPNLPADFKPCPLQFFERFRPKD